MPGRLKKKPQYNPELQFNDFLEELSNAYEETSSLRILATELNISPLKLRKLLIDLSNELHTSTDFLLTGIGPSNDFAKEEIDTAISILSSIKQLL